MATMARRIVPTVARMPPIAVVSSSAPYVLSSALLVAATVAAVGSLAIPDVMRGPAVSVGSAQGTAFVVLFVAVPVLGVSMLLAARGSIRAVVAWLGAMAYIGYQSVLFLFGTPFNGLFLVYVAMWSLAIWSTIALLVRVPVERVAGEFRPATPVRALGAYLIAVAGLFYLLWLRAIVPAVLSSEAPAFLAGTGLLTGPGQILDLGFALPVTILAGTWLWQRRPWGYLLAGAMLVMLAIESTSIAVDQWFGHVADAASPVVSVEMVPVFAVMTVVGLVALAAYLRSMSGGSRGEPAG